MRPEADDELTLRPAGKMGFRPILLVIVGLLGLSVWILELTAEIPEYALPRLLAGFSLDLPVNADGLRKKLQPADPPTPEDWSKLNKGDAWSYAYYSSSRKELRQPMPPDYDEVWRQLDPDNALWPLMALPRGTTKADRDALRDRIEEASRMTGLNRFKEEFFRAQNASYGQPHSWAEAMVIGSWANRKGASLAGTEQAILTECETLEKDGSREQLEKTLGAGRRIALLMEMEQPGVGYQVDYEGELIPGLAWAATKAGLKGEEARLTELQEAQKLLPEKEGWDPLESQWAMMNKGSAAERAMVAMSVRLVWLMAAGGWLLGAGLVAMRLLPPRWDSRDLADKRTGRLWIKGLILPLLWCAGWLGFFPEVEVPYSLHAYVGVVTAATVMAAIYWAAGREVERRTGMTGLPGRWLRNAIVFLGFVPPVLLGSVTINSESWRGILESSALLVTGTVILAIAGYWLFYPRSQELDLRERRVVRTMIPMLLAAGWLGLVAAPGLREIERKLVAGPVDSLWVRVGEKQRDPTAYLQALRALRDQWQGK